MCGCHDRDFLIILYILSKKVFDFSENISSLFLKLEKSFFIIFESSRKFIFCSEFYTFGEDMNISK